MENTEYTPYKNLELFNNLNKTKIQAKTDKHQDCWLLSNLSALYPQFLKPDFKIPIDSFSNNLHEVILQHVHAFEILVDKPIHITTIETKTDNIFENGGEFKVFDKPTDQKLSRLACEYLFKQYRGAEFTQSYFLFPDCSFSELTQKADDIAVYRKYQWVNNVINILTTIILRVTSRSKLSVYDALNVLWGEFLNTTDLQEIKQSYKIEHSPLDHIKPDYWVYMINMFKDIALQLDPHTELDLEDVKNQCRESANNARRFFEKYYKKPEELLSDTDFSVPAKEINMVRKQFWFNNYKKSL